MNNSHLAGAPEARKKPKGLLALAFGILSCLAAGFSLILFLCFSLLFLYIMTEVGKNGSFDLHSFFFGNLLNTILTHSVLDLTVKAFLFTILFGFLGEKKASHALSFEKPGFAARLARAISTVGLVIGIVITGAVGFFAVVVLTVS